MPHLCYSPDLAQCDFEVFGTVKESFEGQEFETEDEILSAIEDVYIQKVMNFGCHFLKVGRNDFKSALIKNLFFIKFLGFIAFIIKSPNHFRSPYIYRKLHINIHKSGTRFVCMKSNNNYSFQVVIDRLKQ